jgi:uncharacterized protein
MENKNYVKFGDWEAYDYNPDFKKNSIVLVGLPGIGNVGKIVTDYLVKTMNATRAMRLFTTSFPHAAYMNRDGTMRRPTVNIYQFMKGKQDFILIAGDLQPTNEKTSYELTRLVFEIIGQGNIKLVTTLGGIGNDLMREIPKVFYTATETDLITKYKKIYDVENITFGSVGPIVGITGTFLTEAQLRGIHGTCLIGETINKELYIGLGGAIEILKILSRVYGLDIKTKVLDKEFSKLKEVAEDAPTMMNQEEKPTIGKELSYIG